MMNRKKLPLILAGFTVVVAVIVALILRRPPETGKTESTVRPVEKTEAIRELGNTQQSTPPPTAAPPLRSRPAPPPDGLSIRFRRSGFPASEVLVRRSLSDAAGGMQVAETITDENGFAGFTVVAGWDATLIDIPTSMTLGYLSPAPWPVWEVEVWEPVRFTGEADFGNQIPIRQTAVRIGTGPRETPSERVRRTTASDLRIDPSEDVPWGMKLLPTPREWELISLDEFGRYTTPWFPAEFEPQFLATTSTGNAGVVEGSFSGLMPRETRTVNVPIQPLTALDVTMDIPEGEQGVAIALGIREATIDPTYADQVAPLMSVLDVVNPGLADFLTARGNVFLTSEEVTRLAPLPPFVELTIVAQGMTPAQTPVKQISIPFGEVTRLHYNVEDLFPIVSSRGTVRGRVLVEGTAEPADNIRITLSYIRGKQETDTDREGRFEFVDVPTEQELTFFVEAFDERNPPRFSRALMEQHPGMTVDQKELDMEFFVPGFRWLIVRDESGDLRPGMEERTIVSLERKNDDGAWEDFTNVLDFYFTEEGCEAEIRIPGTWRAKALVNGSTIRFSEEAEMRADTFEAVVDLRDVRGDLEPRRLRILLPHGEPAVMQSALLVPKFPDAQPIELVTDYGGLAETPPTNIEWFGLRIDTDEYEFGGDIELPAKMITEVYLLPVE